MSELQISVDASSIVWLQELLQAAGAQIHTAIRRAVNDTGDKTTTLVSRALAKQVGVKYGTVKAALRQQRASFGSLTYKIIAKGPALSLKEFGARQTSKGASAAPWNTRRVFPHSFIAPGMGGHVFVRTTDKRFPVKKLWGPAIPNELVRDASAATFEHTVDIEFPAYLEREVMAILSGNAPPG